MGDVEVIDAYLDIINGDKYAMVLGGVFVGKKESCIEREVGGVVLKSGRQGLPPPSAEGL